MFRWQVCDDKIQSTEQLAEIESTEHIFVQCVLAKFGWSILRDVLDWSVVIYTFKFRVTWKIGIGVHYNQQILCFLIWLLSMESLPY
jgi:hypothetical protein